uniref:Uncharacterized protein n=1 Tax=Cacopsylla melanoneura TaxID=428564 RepID=A0A8D9B2E4_9HEMI
MGAMSEEVAREIITDRASATIGAVAIIATIIGTITACQAVTVARGAAVAAPGITTTRCGPTRAGDGQAAVVVATTVLGHGAAVPGSRGEAARRTTRSSSSRTTTLTRPTRRSTRC